MPPRKAEKPNETNEMWREYEQAQRERRAARLPIRTQEILDLRGDNFDVRPLTEFQFRVDGRLDLYPTHRRYHDITSGHRGTYHNAYAVAVRYCRPVRGGADAQPR